jgi:hypothetical protein
MLRLARGRRSLNPFPRNVSLSVLVLAVGLAGAGCSGGQAPPVTAPSATAPSASPSASLLTRYPQAELAQRPCLALDARDLAALGVTGPGKEESGEHGPSCTWNLAGQNVSLDLDVATSFAKTMTEGGRVSQVPVGQHSAVQAEFQRICFTFVAVDALDHLIGTTSIPDPGAPQEGACPAGASVLAAALTHLR